MRSVNGSNERQSSRLFRHDPCERWEPPAGGSRAAGGSGAIGRGHILRVSATTPSLESTTRSFGVTTRSVPATILSVGFTTRPVGATTRSVLSILCSQDRLRSEPDLRPSGTASGCMASGTAGPVSGGIRGQADVSPKTEVVPSAMGHREAAARPGGSGAGLLQQARPPEEAPPASERSQMTAADGCNVSTRPTVPQDFQGGNPERVHRSQLGERRLVRMGGAGPEGPRARRPSGDGGARCRRGSSSVVSGPRHESEAP